jgi:hypothetical protein
MSNSCHPPIYDLSLSSLCSGHGHVICNGGNQSWSCECDDGWTSTADFLSSPFGTNVDDLQLYCGQPLILLTILHALVMISRIALLIPLLMKLIRGVSDVHRRGMVKWYISLITFPGRFLVLLALEHLILAIIAACHLLDDTLYSNESRLVIGHSIGGTLLFTVWLNLWGNNDSLLLFIQAFQYTYVRSLH